MTPTDIAQAKLRIARFIDLREGMRGLDPDEVNEVKNHGQSASLYVSDLVALLEAPMPQVYISQNTGYVVDTMVTRGDPEKDVDVIFIDWSEITPDHGSYVNIQLDTLIEAAEASLRLPTQTALGNLREMVEFLEDFPGGSDEMENEVVQAIKDLKGHITELEAASVA